MISCLENKAIDKPKWDALIAECGNIYAYSWYLDIVHPGWDALVDDNYQAVMPLTGGKKFGVNYLFQPFFVQQLGVFSKTPMTEWKLKDFLDAIPEKYRFCELRLNESNTLDNDIEGFDYHRNILLDLNQDIQSLRANYHQNTKRNLAKAETHNLHLLETVQPQQVVEYGVLLRLVEEAEKHDAAFVLGVTDQEGGDPLCAAIFMQTNDRITFLFSGLNEEGKQCQAMTYLIDQVIQRHAKQPITFDFEGSDNDNLARFYLGFGGREVRYPGYTFNRMSPIGKALLKVWKRRK
ncbi:MAG: hypothetical protein F083_1539 [bacterium F083]|nr:MAG: hypothetical protein F083_1539 [bacterium F083]